MAKDFVGRTGLKMSELKAKGKVQNPSQKKKGSGDFPSMEETNFFDPKSLGMRAGRGSSLPRRKAAPLEMAFNALPTPKKAKPPTTKKTEKDPYEVY